MECPKCGAEIEKNALVCPNCKKVLKIICPVCKTVNTKNTCRKCGEVLVVKCAKCGKINLTKNAKCVKCGYSNEVSVIQGESNTDEFALLRIDFPNADLIKAKLGSNKLFTKFKTNLDNMIVSYLNTLKLRRQITKEGIYLIRFNNVYTMNSSANSAINATIQLANLITKLNVKLGKRTDVFLKCNFTIMKRFADGNPFDYDSGFQANILAQNNNKDLKALDFFQIITDEDFYEIYNEKYRLESLNSVLIDGSMKQFYEIDIKDLINIKEFLEQDNDDDSDGGEDVPQFVQTSLIEQEKITQETLEDEHEVPLNELYNANLIDFDEVNCAFYMTDNIRVLDNVVEVLNEVPKGVLAIKGADMYQPYTLKLLSTVDGLGIYQNIIPITCHDDMKYSPYSFFRDLISSIFEYTVSQKLFDKNDFSAFKFVDSSNLIKDLVTLTQRDMTNLEDTREKYFEVFLSLLQAIPDTLIYIENFEKIDSSSLFVLEQLFEHFEELNISYIVSCDKDFSLHKSAHFLLSRPYYTEITLRPSRFEDVIESDIDFYKNIMDDFYFQRIAKYSYGSTLFLDFAIQYLVESGVYSYGESSISMVNPKTIIIPSSLDELIKRRINLLKDDKRAIKFLTLVVLLGTRVDVKTIDTLGVQDWKSVADKLSQMGYLYLYNDCIYFSNYSLLRKNIMEILKPEDIQVISDELFANVFVDSMPNPVKIMLYELTGENHQTIIFEWEKLANINLSMGDFSSYLNCSDKIIQCLDKYSADWSKEELEKYKSSIYENIANNMFEYDPEQTREIADKTLENLQKTFKNKNFVDLCTKMIQGALYNGDYQYALTLTHKMLSVMENVSIDPSCENFDLNFLVMSMIHVKILFNIGAYNDCLDIGYNILNVLDRTKIEQIKYTVISKQEFKELIKECLAFIAIADVLSLKEDVSEFLDISAKLFDFMPPEYQIFIQLQNLIKGNPVQVPASGGNNIFTVIVWYFLRAFHNCKNNPTNFAKEVYKAKLMAKNAGLYCFELFADLLIGYCYIQLNMMNKALSIIYKIIKVSQAKGLNAITHIAFYVMSILNIKQGRIDIACGVLNNSEVLMEKNGGVSDYLTVLNKVNLYKAYMLANDKEKAKICMTQATYIVQKYNLNFNLNIDINKLMKENQVNKNSQPNLNNQAPEFAAAQQSPINEQVLTQEPEDTNLSVEDEIVNPEDFFS